jgi:hypothetical protein
MMIFMIWVDVFIDVIIFEYLIFVFKIIWFEFEVND